ncbi:hypothetical protein Poli38472_013068 [Pythium oligandrum]|uniref:Dienelactone hydrolase domain-containing protein n=1 Tax=Pythium oligandrum TaxID=41045 RepID=A0A8K1CIX7_PYTOL|nr:hypothetical protein Poli38472_013068 [Pythium oligandrum]|eukprot:TMW64446.1 hypothetical protein Poli38472_013068 [Pythium oligandrum]
MSACCPPESEPARPTSPFVGDIKQFGQTSLYVAGSATAKEDADRLGQEGYVVVIVDVTKGDYFKEDDDIKVLIGEWLIRTDYSTVLKPSIDDAIAYLKQEAQVDHILSYGYCYGAWIGARLSTDSPPRIEGHVSFHPSWLTENSTNGGPGTMEKMTEAIKVPQLLLSGSNDPAQFHPGNSVEKILKANPTIGVLSQVVDYEYVKHGWVNRGDLSDEKVKAAADDAWSRARAFFASVLA